ncbi:EAL domain-containing protein [Paracoccus aestuariivivens]|uniref:EAL domain-containing protein n=1 Tax=Paracoccus aestuariivivens TaxID=1820333 RepID=A0A6L6JGE6_9RHOB|nr:EAL domain-containing protein [Paracoccus aestuariivivens]MTH79204.1 EAL domain-containing protein [Paracoccus aestuariivivens]
MFRNLAVPGIQGWDDIGLGPVGEWGDGMRVAVQTMASLPKPACILWGLDRVLVYNPAFSELLGELHPRLFGARLSDLAPSARGQIEPDLEAIHDGQNFIMQWHLGKPERAYDVACSPVRAEDGKVLAVLCSVTGDHAGAGVGRGTGARSRMKRDLGIATQNGLLDLHYQPQIRLSDEHIIGFEALARWQHPVLGDVAPDCFIPVAEETDLILEIGRWVISKAVEDIASHQNRGQLAVAVNVSPAQFYDPELVDHVGRTLKEHDLPPELLELEITESMALENEEVVCAGMAALHDLGIKIAMDDFGSGYSNIATLKQFSFDRLKLDRSFLADLPTSEAGQAAISNAIRMGKGLGLEIIAEGVETGSQLDLLRALDCDYAQGFFYAAPMPIDDAMAWLVQHDAAGSAKFGGLRT